MDEVERGFFRCGWNAKREWMLGDRAISGQIRREIMVDLQAIMSAMQWHGRHSVS